MGGKQKNWLEGRAANITDMELTVRILNKKTIFLQTSRLYGDHDIFEMVRRCVRLVARVGENTYTDFMGEPKETTTWQTLAHTGE